MRILNSSDKYSTILNGNNPHVPLEIVSAVDEVVSEESNEFFKLLDGSGKVLY